MNRRAFIGKFVLGAGAFTILPGAGRVWRARRELTEWQRLPTIDVSQYSLFGPSPNLFDLLLDLKRERDSVALAAGRDPNAIEIVPWSPEEFRAAFVDMPETRACVTSLSRLYQDMLDRDRVGRFFGT